MIILFLTVVVAPGDRLVTLPHHDLQEDSPEPSLDGIAFLSLFLIT